MADTHGNGGVATLNADISSGATSISIASSSLPTSGTFMCHMTDGTNHELVYVTAGAGTSTLTVTRAAEAWQGSSTAYAFSVAGGTKLYEVLTADQVTAVAVAADLYLAHTCI